MKTVGDGEMDREIGQPEVLDPHGRDEHKCIGTKMEKCIDARMDEKNK